MTEEINSLLCKVKANQLTTEQQAVWQQSIQWGNTKYQEVCVVVKEIQISQTVYLTEYK